MIEISDIKFSHHDPGLTVYCRAYHNPQNTAQSSLPYTRLRDTSPVSDSDTTVDSVDMQKSCRIEGCQRKFDKTSHSDLCPPCSNAFRSGETQTTKRAEHQQRQQNARAQALSANRNIPLNQGNSPPQPTTTQGFQFTVPLPTSLPIVTQTKGPAQTDKRSSRTCTSTQAISTTTTS